MIARHETHMDKLDIWSKLSAPLPAGVISWRQDGKSILRDGKHFARFVAYVEANTVRERLDTVVPGEWDLTLELLPTLPGEDGETTCSFKARLQILGVIREDVGTGRDYKAAATDAFKRVGVRFGIAHELYAYEQNWVQVDSDSKYAKPIEDPAEAYARRQARSAARADRKAERRTARRDRATNDQSPAEVPVDDAVIETTHVVDGPHALDEPSCPKCGGRMWDNRLSKRNPKAPDYKCRDRSCDGVIWPVKGGEQSAPRTADAGPLVGQPELTPETDEIPF